MVTNDNRLAQLFFEHRGKSVDKWEQYLGIYAREFAPFLTADKPVRLLEIGVQNGGSLELWAKYLPEGSEIIGVDIDTKVGELTFEGNVTVHVADATDPVAMLAILGDKTFDIVIDDGSHHSRDIIAAFTLLYPRLEAGGKFVIEDLHASYWRDFGGGVQLESSAIEFFKQLADALNTDYFEPGSPVPVEEVARLQRLNRMLASVSFYDSVVVVENLTAPKTAPYRHLISGLESQVFDPLPVYSLLPADKIESILFSEPQKHRVDRGLLEKFLQFRSEHDRLLAQDAQLAARDKELAERDGLIAERNRQLAERDDLIAERDRRLAEQDGLLSERERQLAEREQNLAERDRELVERETLLEERDGQFAERQALLAEREGLLAKREALLAEREAVLAERDGLLPELDGLLAQQEALIADLDGRLAERDRQLAERDREIAKLQAFKERLRLQALAFRDQVAATRTSASWRITAPMRWVSRRLRGRPVDYSLQEIISDDHGGLIEIAPPPVFAVDEPEAAPIAAAADDTLPAIVVDDLSEVIELAPPGADVIDEPAAAPLAVSEEEPLPILEPLAAAENGTTVAVVYLARSADGSVSDFEPFIASYRAHNAGIPHDLIIIRKGLIGRYGSQAALALMLEGIPHRTVDISDDGFDIQAYLKLALALRHDRVCFLNTFSEINADNWLRKLNAPLDRAEVGAAGATGSYESLFTSWVLLTKVIWLTSSKHIPYSSRVAEQYREFLVGQAPAWLAEGESQVPVKQPWWQSQILKVRGSVVHRTEPPVARWDIIPAADTEALERAFDALWKMVTDPGAGLFTIRDFRPFPNPHLRSNAFIIRRKLLLDFGFVLDNTKTAASRFESGPDGLPVRLAALGLSAVVVGADGNAYEVADWPKSRTFRLGDQSNILVADNQVRGFAAMSEWHRKLHVRMSWGDYLTGSETGLVDFGVDFPQGSLSLGAPRSETAEAPKADLLFSVVIPTHNRLALLRDAVDSVLRQPPGNWECVVFDNASEEPIGAYVASLNDPRVRYQRSDEFLPVTESWNRAMDLAKGDYVTLIGDDDGVVPDYFGKLTKLAEEFHHPDVIYSALYQFFHPMVAPWQRAGYVTDLRNGFFFENKETAFLLDKSAARKAAAGSLTLHRNFTFNMQAFAFSRNFLDKVRVDGKIFHSPFPDYYLANMVMGMAETIVVSPEPLAVAGVSRASFGYTLFNNLEAKGAAMLNAKLREDGQYNTCEPYLLPGPAYNTNYIITMAHVAQRLGDRAPAQVDFQRYRRMQIFAVVTAQDRLDWMRAEPGSLLWSKLSIREKAWASYLGLLYWRSKAGDARAKQRIDAINNAVQSTGFAAIQLHTVAGRFARLPELLDALEAGAYPGSL